MDGRTFFPNPRKRGEGRRPPPKAPRDTVVSLPFSTVCQKTETCVVRTCHTPRQPLPNHRSGHLVMGWKLAWFGHVTKHDTLSKTVPKCTLEGGRRHGRQRELWMEPKSGHPCPCQNCSQGPPAEKDWKIISAESFLMSSRRPGRSRNCTELNEMCVVSTFIWDFMACALL